MQQEIVPGVKFNFEKQDKFKNVSISLDFVEPLANNHLVERAMVAEMMENYSAKYDSKLKLARKLAELYGARFGTNIFKVGNVVVLRVFITFINERFLEKHINLVEQICSFLQEIIFHPYFIEGVYPTEPFKLQRDNLVDYLKNLNDNKKYYAARQAKQLYFADEPQHAKLVFGKIDELAEVTPQKVAAYYHTMLAQNEIYISVVGKLDHHQIKTIQSAFNFAPRPQVPVSLSNHPDKRLPLKKTEVAVQKQSQLDLMYAFPVHIKSEDYYAALVMNALLGGSATSLMFLNIREKHSLAYYISSSFNSTLGFVMIQSGIDGDNAAQVQQLIATQIKKLIEGNYDDALLNKVKLSLISGYLTTFDSERKTLNEVFIASLTNHQINKDEWISRVKAIDKAQISQVAQKLALKAVFLLKGEING